MIQGQAQTLGDSSGRVGVAGAGFGEGYCVVLKYWNEMLCYSCGAILLEVGDSLNKDYVSVKAYFEH